MTKILSRKIKLFQVFAMLLSTLILLDTLAVADKGRDIIIYNGKVILKNGKKKGKIIISGGEHGDQGNYKYKQRYANYGGFW